MIDKIIYASLRRVSALLFKTTAQFYSVCGLVMFLVYPDSASAWEQINSDQSSAIRSDSQRPAYYKPLPDDVRIDSCLSLLPHESASFADRFRRKAEPTPATVSAVAVGFLLGVRYAPGPEEIHHKTHRRAPSGSSSHANDKGGSAALAVARYRQCKKEEALNRIETAAR